MFAAIYVRKSTDQTGVADEQKSVTRQIDHARAYATSKGWTVADEHVYVIAGGSLAMFIGSRRVKIAPVASQTGVGAVATVAWGK
jgi:hypothetical protein